MDKTPTQIEEVEVNGVMISVADVVEIVERPDEIINGRHSFKKVIDALPAILALLKSEAHENDPLVLGLREVMKAYRAALIKELKSYAGILRMKIDNTSEYSKFDEQNESFEAKIRRIESFLQYFEA